MESSKEQGEPERPNQEPEDNLTPGPGERMDAVPESNPMTAEGYIEGIGNFAQGFKRMIRRWRHK